MTDEEKNERIATLIERLSEDPQLMEKVGEMIEASATQTAACAEEVPTVQASAAEQVSLSKNGDKDRRHHLLTALRPYLSDRRAKALDSFEAIADLLEYMKT